MLQIILVQKPEYFFLYSLYLYICVSEFKSSEAASVRTARPSEPRLFIVTPEPAYSNVEHFSYFLPTPLPEDTVSTNTRTLSENTRTTQIDQDIKTTETTTLKYGKNSFPYFIPTPLPEDESSESKKSSELIMAKNNTNESSNESSEVISNSEARYFPQFLPTPLPDYDFERNQNHLPKISPTSQPPDIIIAEFKPGKNGKQSDGMVSVKEMLSKEKVPFRTSKKNPSTTSTTTTETSNMKVEDVWDIIRHNQKLEKTITRIDPVTQLPVDYSMDIENEQSSEKVYSLGYKYNATGNSEYSVETIPSVILDKDEWSSAVPDFHNLMNKTDKRMQELEGRLEIDEPRTTRGGSSWGYPEARRPDKIRYSSSQYSDSYSNVDDVKHDPYLSVGVAEDRYNPAQPYLPPKPDAPKPQPKPKPQMPPPPVPMPPPPPPPKPQQVMAPPSFTYDSLPSYSDSKPPDMSYSYSAPTDESGPPSSYPSDDSFKFDSPPSDATISDSDTYPQLIFDDHHHHSHESDYHDFHDYHHHYHDHPPPPLPPPTTTTTTPAPTEDKRVNNRFSYYYLGKKLWYLPLYFSVYFIIYVGALIIKSISRHKITYPQHWKTKRSLDFKMTNEELHNLTRLTSNALMKFSEKYMKNNS